MFQFFFFKITIILSHHKIILKKNLISHNSIYDVAVRTYTVKGSASQHISRVLETPKICYHLHIHQQIFWILN
jgi:hypothetical protein